MNQWSYIVDGEMLLKCSQPNTIDDVDQARTKIGHELECHYAWCIDAGRDADELQSTMPNWERVMCDENDDRNVVMQEQCMSA